MKRLVRDVLILIAFCSAFYMLTLFVGREDKFSRDRSNFSRERILADESVSNRDWESAIAHYDKLLEEDPFNELAMVRRARADLKLTEGRVKNLRQRKASAGEDQQRLKQIDSEIAKFVAESIASQEQLLLSSRFRDSAIRNEVILHCIGGNIPEAIEALEVYANEASTGAMNRPLSFDSRLKVLRREPAFIKLYVKEREASAFYRQ